MSEVADTAVAEMPAPIVFTDSAAAKVADLIAEEGNPDLKLRVFVQGVGWAFREKTSWRLLI